MGMTNKNIVQSGKGREADDTRKIALHKPMAASRVKDIRSKHAMSGQGAISAAEANEMLEGGNKGHQDNLAPEVPRKRHEKARAGELDYVLFMCSDARNPKTDSEDDGSELVGSTVRIAGNVLSADGASREEAVEMLRSLKQGGSVVVMGHCNCGAMGAHLDGGDTGNEELNHLVTDDVCGQSSEENALAQRDRIIEALKELGREDVKVTAMVYDWSSEKGVRILGEPASELAQLLADKWQVAHELANADGRLADRLAVQKPHTIAVVADDMPFTVATVFGAAQNEIFATTGSDDGLDYADRASLLYAALHLHVKHIAFVAPVTDAESLEGMFSKWEDDLRGMKVKGEPVLADMLDSGELTITRLGYDLSNGAAKQI